MKLFGTVVVVASFALLGGCKAKESTAEPTSATASAPIAAAAPKKLEIPGTGVAFTPPAGWDKAQKNEWTVLSSPPDTTGNVAALEAFVTFDQPNESTAKLGTVAMALGLNAITWGGRETLDLPGGFPATGASGTCSDADGNPCEIHYLTINPGGSEQILFVYTVDASASKTLDPAIIASLKSLKKDG
jgi:hypothetical protein